MNLYAIPKLPIPHTITSSTEVQAERALRPTPYPSAKMTDTEQCEEYDAHGEDELQFHIELGEASLPASTVPTFDPYIFDRYYLYHLDSSRPAGGHALGKPRICPHEPEPEPSNTNSLHFLLDSLNKKQSSPSIMAAQAMEALNRTFIELKSKNDETRLRASHDLRDLVVAAARGKAIRLFRSSCIG